jgi:hypothetical protein
VAPNTDVVRVQVGAEWHCAIVDRSEVVEIEQQLLRDVIPSDPGDCPDCVAEPAAERSDERAPEDGPSASVQAAAIALAGRRMLVVLVPLDLVLSPGEAEMLVADLRPRFGGVDVVLMGQEEDGAPRYHGDAELLLLLAGVPAEQLPWKVYPLG